MESPYTPAAVMPEWLVLSAALAFAGNFVALDLALRMRSARRGVALRRLSLAAASMCAGLWSAHAVAAMSVRLPFPFGYDGVRSLLAFLAGDALSMAGLALVGFGRASWRRLAGAALTTALAIVAVQRISVLSMGLRPGIEWSWPQQLAALLVALPGAALSLGRWCIAACSRGGCRGRCRSAPPVRTR